MFNPKKKRAGRSIFNILYADRCARAVAAFVYTI